MSDTPPSAPDPDADDPHAVLGVPTDADREQVRLAASVAKQRYNPDRYPDAEKRRARERFYEVVAAEEALLGGGGEGDGDGDGDSDDGDGREEDGDTVRPAADAGLSPSATPRLSVTGDDGPWEPRVPAGEPVTVRVRDGEDGRALAGVSVAARSLAADGGRARAATDAAGRATFDLGPGRWVLRVEGEGESEGESESVGEGEETANDTDTADADDTNTADTGASGPVAVRVARPAPAVDARERDRDGDESGVSPEWRVRVGTLATVGGLAGLTLAVALGWPPVAWVTSVAVGVAGVAALWRTVS